jgi:hypothetical protein
MKITYLTVCVNYLDFFAITYRHNKTEFDDFVVVTDLQDNFTEKYCNDNNIKVVKTNKFYENGAVFNKGLAINEGFKVMKNPDWVVFMDADTFVAPNFKKSLPELDKEFFYGARRVLLPTFDDYIKLSKATSLDGFEIPSGAGFGWFQMFNWGSSVVQNSKIDELYPSFPDARESDWMFRNKWGDYVHGSNYTKIYGNYAELPLVVYNLGEHGKNHFGRVTPNFLDKIK